MVPTHTPSPLFHRITTPKICVLRQPTKSTTGLRATEHDIDNIESLEELQDVSDALGGPDLLECASLDEARDKLWDWAMEAGSEEHDHDHDHEHSHDHDEDVDCE